MRPTGTPSLVCILIAPAAAAYGQCFPHWRNPGGGVSLGSFTGAQALAGWDGGPASADVYAGGNFARAGAAAVQNVARWDGVAWHALGGGLTNAGPFTFVYGLQSFRDGSGEALYAAGLFSHARGLSAANVARWDGAAWSEAGGGTDGAVFDLIAWDEDGGGPAAARLVACGAFTISGGGLPTPGIAAWDGVEWSAIGNGLGQGDQSQFLPSTLFGEPGRLLVGGVFGRAGSAAVRGLAQWTPGSPGAWSAFGPLLERSGGDVAVEDIEVFDGGASPRIHVTGRFNSSQGVTLNHIARFEPGTPGHWQALGVGLTGAGAAGLNLRAWDDGRGEELWVGGRFPRAGGLVSAGLAAWNGAEWRAVGTGLNVGSQVNALLPWTDVDGPAMYVGGAFFSAGGLPVSNIARLSHCSTVCYADCDSGTGRGALDIFDFLCFQNRYDGADPYACDCDVSTGVGLCDIFDFLCFQNAYDAGCP